MTVDESVLFKDKDEWEAWLEANHASSTGIWLQIAKKGCAVRTVSYADGVEVALCFGWIDSQNRSGPDGFFYQRFSPRGPKSIWSKVNRAKALGLIESGKIRPAGLATIEKAKQNGRWDAAYDGVSTATVPDDLADALKKNKKAGKFFQQINSQNRYAILFRLQKTQKPETRGKLLQRFVEMLAAGETIYPSKTEKPSARKVAQQSDG